MEDDSIHLLDYSEEEVFTIKPPGVKIKTANLYNPNIFVLKPDMLIFKGNFKKRIKKCLYYYGPEKKPNMFVVGINLKLFVKKRAF